MDMSISQDGMVQVGQAILRLKADIPGVVSRVVFAAAGISVDAARPTVPRDSGDAARSLRHFLTNTGAAVEGGASVDYYRWLELGGASGRKHANKRPTVADGRYIYPGYLRSEQKIQIVMEESLSKAVTDAGLAG